MQYSFIPITIRQLVDYIDNNQIDLNPPYQRNFIWSPKDQQELVNTILSGYPLPNFFIYTRPDGIIEMVDGQQRSKTIYRFVKGYIKSGKETGGLLFSQTDRNQILNYILPFVSITNLAPNESLNDFYVLINKKGRHCLSPLKDWTDLKNQLVTLNLGRYEYNKKEVECNREAPHFAGIGSDWSNGGMPQASFGSRFIASLEA